jgi:hypothetical protein
MVVRLHRSGWSLVYRGTHQECNDYVSDAIRAAHRRYML